MDGARRRGGLPDHVGQQAFVAGGGAGDPGRQDQLPDAFAPVGDGELPGLGGAFAVLDQQRVGDLHADVRRPERLPDRTGQREELRLGVVGGLQPFGQAGDHVVGVVAVAHDPAPDQPPQPSA